MSAKQGNKAMETVPTKSVNVGSAPGAGLKPWIWLAVLTGYAGYFGYLLFSGRLEDLVSPRMTVFVVLGFVTLVAFLLVRILAIVKRSPQAPLKRGLVLFLAPFAFIPFALNPNSALLSLNRGISLEQGQGPPPIDLTTKLHAAVNPFLPQPKPKPLPRNGAVPRTGTIVLGKNNYYRVYQELYADPAAFVGRTITVSGFVYHDPKEPAGRFIAARELMWCCAADAVAIGFMTHSKNAIPVKSTEWVSVTGHLATTDYVDRYTQVKSVVPVIEISHIDHLKGPDFVFVYPS